MKTPHKIKLIVEIQLITMSNSLPRTLSSLNRHKNQEKVKTPTNAHNDLIKLIIFKKRESARLIKGFGIRGKTHMTS